MRTLWNAFSFLAVVNLLALILVIAWLGYSDRLDRDRLEAMRDLLSPPISAVDVEETTTQVVSDVAIGDGIDPLQPATLPATHLGPIALSELRTDLEAETRLSLEKQAATLRTNIDHHYRTRRQEIEARENAVVALESRFEEIRERSADDDFKQTVADLEEMKLDAAFGIVQAWLNQARTNPARRTLVVDVLAALDSERRTKLLTEFVDTGQPEVAADLQLDLRDRASLTAFETESLDADHPSSNDPAGSVAVGGDRGP